MTRKNGAVLLERRFGTVILDEAHKARRRGGLGAKKDEPNNLLDFMLHIGPRTKNLLLGTATPIQTEVHELWDLMRILNAGADFVLGREAMSLWVDMEQALPVVKGEETPVDEREAWEWLRNPLPPGDEEPLVANLRLQLGIPDQAFFTDQGFGSLGIVRTAIGPPDLGSRLLPGAQSHRPPYRPPSPSDLGGARACWNGWRWTVHPDPDAPSTAYPGVGLDGLGLLTNHPFDLAYKAAEDFTSRPATAHQGRRFHEDTAAPADLLQLRFRSQPRPPKCCGANCSKTKRTATAAARGAEFPHPRPKQGISAPSSRNCLARRPATRSLPPSAIS